MTRWFLARCAWALVFWGVVCGLVVHDAAVAQPVRREILALYDGEREGRAEATRIHRFAELPLNHLGYFLHYHDVRGGLPDLQKLERYAAVLTWLIGAVPEEDAYLAWLDSATRHDLRFIVLGEVGAVVTARNLRLANRFLEHLGVQHTGIYVSPGSGARAVLRDPALYDYECRLDPVLPDFPVLDRAQSGSTVVLEVGAAVPGGGRHSSLVAIGRRGGFAAFNFEFCHQTEPLHRGKWLIEPFAFFRAALGNPLFPVPDTTTMSGRRLYFSLVHSDGLSLPTDSSSQRRPGEIAGQVVAAELIDAFPALPITLDLRESDLDRPARSAAAARALAERLLALPRVSRPGKRPVASKLARLDASYDSISNLTPLAVTGKERIVLTASSSERAYRSRELPRSLGFLSLRETLARSEVPRRLKPANINYHMDVGADRALIGILRKHLAGMRDAPLAPISASYYADIAEGFFTTTVEELDASSWRIRNRGALQTLRLDDAAGHIVDMATSKGVVGYNVHAGSLYVALDEAVDTATVSLAKVDDRRRAIDGFVLVDSRWRVRGLQRGTGRTAFETEGFGPGEFRWKVAPGSMQTVAVSRGAAVLWSADLVADDQGELAFVVPVAAIEPVSFEIITRQQ